MYEDIHLPIKNSERICLKWQTLSRLIALIAKHGKTRKGKIRFLTCPDVG